jgi:abortive infection bacteriophage resistance protein
MDVKPPKYHVEQIDILRKRGCLIEDEQKAYDLLCNVNYYRLSGYFYPFRAADDMFQPETSFERIAALYAFDNRLRATLSLAIGNAEIASRAEIAYFHANKYGALGYLDARTFKTNFDITGVNREFSNVISRNSNSPIIKHHIAKYEGKFPLWVVIEFFTMGMTSKFFYNLGRNNQKRIADRFNLMAVELQSLLYCLTMLRNACAHYDRLYAVKFKATPRFPFDFPSKADSSLFSHICVLKLLNRDKDEWNNTTFADISALVHKYREHLDFDHIGFPDDWENVLRW